MEGVLSLGGKIFIYFYVSALVLVLALQSLAGIATLVTWVLGIMHWL